MTLEHRFVEFIPDELQEGILYITVEYRTAAHKCVCGCGNKVLTPITPTDWKLIFDGKTISLHPSIGNWNFPCQSHYWIRHNVVEHSHRWSEKEIANGRKKDLKRKKNYFKWFAKLTEPK